MYRKVTFFILSCFLVETILESSPLDQRKDIQSERPGSSDDSESEQQDAMWPGDNKRGHGEGYSKLLKFRKDYEFS